MSAKFFVDTNVLMYAHGSDDARKQETARALLDELWAARSGAVSTQVLQELCVNLQRRVEPPLDISAVRLLMQTYSRWEVVTNTTQSILDALRIQDRYGISFWDALIIQAAESAGVDVIYSEDLAGGQVYGSVRVVNPFAAAR